MISATDKRFIESVLANDEAITDDEMADHIFAQTGLGVSADLCRDIVSNERQKFALDFRHHIDWSKYDNHLS